MSVNLENISVITCNSNRPLALEICKYLNIKIANADVITFSDGEISVNIKDSIRGKSVYVIQSVAPPNVNNYLMELLITIDALKRASAGMICAVIPYYGYARQDRKAKARDPISAKLVADIITTAGADRVITMDLHAAQIQGYFNIPVDNLLGSTILAKYFENFDTENTVVVSPDLGSVTRSRNFASHLHLPLAIIDKRRPKPNVAEVMNIIGDVKGKDIIIIDDIIDTAGTIVNAANALKEHGAKDIYIGCTHAIFSGEAIERLKTPAIKKILVLNTINLSDDKKLDKMETLSVAELFAKTIKRVHENESVSELFDDF